MRSTAICLTSCQIPFCQNDFRSAAYQHILGGFKINKIINIQERKATVLTKRERRNKTEYIKKVIKEHFTEWFMEITLS